ncbi:MAG TPA: hypothetical protein PKN22_01300 [Taishania sp.]|nr:hypothetical protein [Taishania sp.]HNS41368.1 hypothetical protein [Taishania sp.]
MKKSRLFFVILVLFFSCNNSLISNDINYKIIETTENKNISKINIKVLLPEKVNRKKLENIAYEIKETYSNFENIWISYFIPNMEINSVSWAFSNFTPNLEIEIVGTDGRTDKINTNTSKIKGEILGKWQCNKSLMGAILVLYRKDTGDIIMRINWDAENFTENVVSESLYKNLKRYDDNNDNGEFYLIENNNNLGMYGINGKFDEALKL